MCPWATFRFSGILKRLILFLPTHLESMALLFLLMRVYVYVYQRVAHTRVCMYIWLESRTASLPAFLFLPFLRCKGKQAARPQNLTFGVLLSERGGLGKGESIHHPTSQASAAARSSTRRLSSLCSFLLRESRTTMPRAFGALAWLAELVRRKVCRRDSLFSTEFEETFFFFFPFFARRTSLPLRGRTKNDEWTTIGFAVTQSVWAQSCL